MEGRARVTGGPDLTSSQALIVWVVQCSRAANEYPAPREMLYMPSWELGPMNTLPQDLGCP
eukprot:15475151-Alexandrium_andersonii.AAC.1